MKYEETSLNGEGTVSIMCGCSQNCDGETYGTFNVS